MDPHAQPDQVDGRLVAGGGEGWHAAAAWHVAAAAVCSNSWNWPGVQVAGLPPGLCGGFGPREDLWPSEQHD